MFAKPTPFPELPRKPTPVSATSTVRRSPWRCALTTMVPPLGERSIPCLIAFSQPLPGFGLDLVQTLHVREGVEKEVRLDLRFHQLEPGLERLPIQRLAGDLRFVRRLRGGIRTAAQHVDERDRTAQHGQA